MFYHVYFIIHIIYILFLLILLRLLDIFSNAVMYVCVTHISLIKYRCHNIIYIYDI